MDDDLKPHQRLVERYVHIDPLTRLPTGDFLRVGDIDLGPFRDLVDAEYQRAKQSHPHNPAFHMRPMWWTGSPYGAEILALADEVRGEAARKQKHGGKR